ncbi:MAG: NADH-quinone oxidoreductase subunit N [Candidatus Omnitrophica bacterium]|nr:NADH-quinone oxidoreductase subunit N [Candidatus Omnitrophota bacterium]
MDWTLILPETALLLLCVLLLCLMLIRKTPAAGVLSPLMGIATAGVGLAALWSFGFSGILFFSTYRVDLFSQCFKLLVWAAFFLTVFFSRSLHEIDDGRRLEYYFFLSAAALGMMMMASAVDLLTLYVSLELASYSLYLLSALKNRGRDAEAGVKYLFFGAAASGVFLWGASLLAGISGSTSLAGISENIHGLIASPASLVGMIFVCFSFLFKLSAFPLHFWAPDVYESAATPVVNFIATASKAAAVAVLARFLMFLPPSPEFVRALTAIAFASMTLGNCVALWQEDVKRLLAYSSVAQAGYILVGLLAAGGEGFSSAIFYTAAYVLMNAAAFFVVSRVALDSGHDNPRLSHFDGLAERSPFLALVLLISLLSLAGIPPLAGFTGKWILFSAAMDKGHWFLVLWAVLNSVVSLFYYLTLVKHAYLEKPKEGLPPMALPLAARTVGLALCLSIILLGIFPNALISLAQEAVLSGGLH